MTIKKFSESARQVIETEGKTILSLLKKIDSSFDQACELLLSCQGHIVVIGIGKSGHIGNKIAATLASTGSPAFFIHAAEANHGDLGMISSKDVLIAISHSGETNELISILPTLKLLNIPFILMTGNPQSTLAQQATVIIHIPIEQEACPLGLAPTSSSTAALVMGDAIAISLLNRRGFSSDDFAKVHPKGQLGRRLLLKVADIMHSGSAIPNVRTGTALIEALYEVSQKRLGMTIITDKNQHLLGIFTDGDLRRAIDQGLNLQTTLVDHVMTSNCKTINKDKLAAEALRIMEDNKITTLIIVDKEKKPLGVVHIHDILSQRIT
ncbi:arabinose-5-phosphate isomerase [Candidatus Rickettsiella isopodorum]|jgi:arabinose-5-phosphate isomerase|uniref:Arabinose 5-phosphate isomerase n=1 Tax=Candidatus Rickettsiella isopodorum TaxID=1225476 RepID=A0A1J8NKD4_9COXI|nr:KpsF/GutQ family sugar-phosphate isomerase [Candidatus Rickettsiella isopodorum]OIZ94494.1 arabinose-5-phosphate isomerase [Candidatus Rickettsiella isopodorum]